MPGMKLRDSIPLWLRAPRNSLWLLSAVLLLALIALISPQQLPVALYKASLISLAAVLGYWLDRALFPYARPDSYLVRDWRLGSTEPEGDVDHPVVPAYTWVFSAAMLRRALVVAAVVLGVAMGL
ncbi:putative holin [Delftia tsuruhatensis]|uniref:putative holin n=1 Tax=Delftia tsuruhatensis TaxID=180282 RepID=UPI002260FDB1|nr:putative holin [Delftia tsuruhatensis]MCX7506631.1 putative holin [Delftia tsuruhatensis]